MTQDAHTDVQIIRRKGSPYLIPLSRYYISVLGQDNGYTVKYNPLPEEFPRAKLGGTPEGKGLNLTVYTELSPNTDNI